MKWACLLPQGSCKTRAFSLTWFHKIPSLVLSALPVSLSLHWNTKFLNQSHTVWPWNLTFDLESRSSKNLSLNVNYLFIPSYQVWSGSVKWFRNYLKLKFFHVQVLSAGRLFVKWSPVSKTHKKHKIYWFLKKKFFFW